MADCLDAPQAAGDLAARSGLAAATVSEHLKVLRKAGLVVLDRRGRFWLYRTDRKAVARVAAAVAAITDP